MGPNLTAWLAPYIHTYTHTLQGDFETLKLSEIHWHGNGSEKFIFDYPSACIIYFAGEVTIIEYGQEEPLGSIRTSFTNSHVLSLRINERKPRNMVISYAYIHAYIHAYTQTYIHTHAQVRTGIPRNCVLCCVALCWHRIWRIGSTTASAAPS